MFTGIIEQTGAVSAVSPGRLAVSDPFGDLRPGESVAVNGVCLTVTRAPRGDIEFDVSPETLSRTTLGSLRPGEKVNLERALRLCDRLGGHLVTGHVDCKGRVAAVRRGPAAVEMEISFPPDLAKYLVAKGSVAVEGVSLTVAAVSAGRFTAALVPHTLSACNLGGKRPGGEVNLEVDILARYLHP